MKKIISSTFLILGILAFASCSNQSKKAVSAGNEQEVSVAKEASIVKISLGESSLKWKGFKPGGEHFGSISLSDGEIKLSGDNLVSGYVAVQMNSIAVEDLEGEMAAKLKGHLESEDFFDSNKYPTAKFELTNLPEGGLNLSKITELTGNLTLKDVTKNITIPIETIESESNTASYKITSKTFTINRADWNVRYGSKSFFDNLADNFIEDNIELQFVILAKK